MSSSVRGSLAFEIRLEADSIQSGLDLRIRHKELPNQARPVVLARYHDTLNQTKKQLVLAAMDEAKGSHIEAARLLGIHPKYLHRLIRNLDLKSDVKRLG